MKIRTRLKISNLLMVLVPVAVAAAAGTVAVLASWLVLSRGAGIGVADSEDFFQASDVIAVAARGVLEEGDDGVTSLADASQVLGMLDTSEMSLVVLDSSGDAAFTYGESTARDEQLLAAASAVPGEVQLSSGNRCLSAHDVEVDASAGGAPGGAPGGAADGETYRLCILGDARAGSKIFTKAVLAVAMLALAAVLVLTVVFLNRFLTRFVLRNITEPLDLLARGTREVRDGNLRVRLPEGRDDEFAPVFAGFNDMTARLQESVERDRRAAQKRSTLLVGLSHDLRSPLTSIQAYAEGLLDGIASTPEAMERYLHMIKSKAEEMGGLVRRISAVAKMDRAAEEAVLEDVRLDELVEAWARENEGAYALRGVCLEVQAEPVRARVDRDLTRRALANLLDNCAVYARRGRGADVRCRVRLTCSIAANSGAVLTVDDDGPGVPDEDLPRLFDLFFRGDAARSVTSEGNGIGLAVVSLAMERMDGTAAASRSPLGGLRVELAFPPCPGSPGAAAETNGEGEEAPHV